MQITSRHASKIAIYSVLFIGAIVMCFPFVWMIIGSLMEPQQIYKFPPDFIPQPVIFSNYIEAMQHLGLRTFANSIFLTGSVTVGVVTLSLLAAFAFAKLRIPGKEYVFLLYILALLVPWQIGLLPRFVIVAKLGWINTYKGMIIPFLGDTILGTYFFRNFFQTIPHDLYDASTIDGASIPRIFFTIYAPLAQPAISAIAAITALRVWNNYIWVLTVTNTKDMRVLTLALSQLIDPFKAIPMGVILASSFVSMAPLLFIYIFAQKWFVQGIGSTGLKS